jgi:imidazoleglycerol phosphate dehydratase HisB
MQRKSEIERNTNETQVSVALNVDGTGAYEIATGVGFLDHMLCLFAKHGKFDLKIKAQGDLETDEHHTVEDVGIALGAAFKQALGDKRGIARYGFFILPMDESLAQAALDLGGRPCLVLDAEFARERVGDLSTELVQDFFEAFAQNAGANVNLRVVGRNEHHKIEALFKAFARALRQACEFDEREKGIPSTKGVL